MPESKPAPALLAATIAIAIVSVSTAAPLLRLSEAPPLVKAFWRLAIAAAFLAAFALARRESRGELRALTRRDWIGLSGVGVVLAVHFASWIWSLDLTTVAASVVLVTIHPLIVGVASAKLYGEGLPRGAAVGIVVAILGGLVIALEDSRRGPNPLLGDALALLGAGAAAAYFLAGRGYRRRLSLLAYVVPVYVASALALLVMALAAGNPIFGWGRREVVIFVALAIVPMILGHTLLNFSLKWVTAPVIATTILGEPVGSTLLAIVVLNEVPAALTLAGGALVLAGIGLVVLLDHRAKRAAALSEAGA